MATRQFENEQSADSGALLPCRYHCIHCGEFLIETMAQKPTKLYCNDCTYASKRKEMCEENKELLGRIGVPHNCKMCNI